jgi:glucose/arabinose dehydrogenase
MALPTFVAPPKSSGSRTLYLRAGSSDSNNGLSESSPKGTFGSAISAAQSGDIIIVDERGGDFGGSKLNVTRDFSTTNPITFRARNWNVTNGRIEGARPRLTTSINFSGCTGLAFQGIDLSGNGSTSTGDMSGIMFVAGASYVSFDGCLIHNYRGGQHGNGQGFLCKENSHHLWFGNGMIYDVGKHIGHDHCTYLQFGHHAWFWNSVFRDSRGFGLHWFGSFDDVYCKYLTIVHNRSSGVTIGGRPGDSTRGPDSSGNYWPDRCVVEDCIITHHDDSSTGGEIHDPGWGFTGYNNNGSEIRFANFVVFNNARGTTSSSANPTNVVNADPRYVNYASRDLRIQSGSPAQAKVTRHSVITKDINGNPRNSTTAYGAYRGVDETGTVGPGPDPDPDPTPVTVLAPTGIIGKPFNGGITVEWNSGISNPGNTTNVSSSLVSQGTASFPIALGAWKNDTEDRQYVVERTGKVFVYKNGVKQTTPFIDVSSIVAPDGSGVGNEGGALSIAFHPNFGTGTNYRFYMALVQKSNNTLYISEFQSSSANVEVASIGTRRDLFSYSSSDSQGRHYGGCIRFGPDNGMYFTVGDMTQSDTAPQNDSNPRGKMHRCLDPTAVSPTSQLVAKGLRNPWKFDFDPGAAFTPSVLVPQDIYVGHVGEATAEAIWRVAGGTNTVRNAGWPNYEGNALRSGYSSITYDQAIIVQTRAAGYRSITGGTVVRDKYVTDQIKNKYIYSDYIKDGLRRADAVTGANDGAAGTLGGTEVASIDRDQFNRSYLLEHNASGRILRLKGAAQTPPQTGFARYRVFVNGTERALTDPTSFVFTLGGLTNGVTYAVEVLAEDSAGNRSTRTSINLTPGTTGGGTPPLTQNLALDKTATASGSEDAATLGPANAVDGSATTRWSSAKFQPTLQWWQVDLGSLQTTETVVINWQAAYSPSYDIQTSTDGTTFTTRLAATATGAGEVTHTFTPVQARYVRIANQQLNTVNTNTSFYEAEVYGASSPPPVDTVAPPAPTGLVMTAIAGGWHATHSDNSKSASDFLKYVWYEDGVQLPGPSDPRSPTYQVTNRISGRVYTIGVEAWDTQTTPNISARTTAPVTPLSTTPGSGTTVALENPISSGPTINSPIQLTGRQSDLYDRFYVASRTDRKMWTVRTGVTQTTPFLDISGIASNWGTQGGVLGFVIHPDLDIDGELAAYFTWTDSSGNWRLTEVKSTNGNLDVASLATRRDLLTLTSLDASGRNLGGGLRFDSNKALWVGIGDNYNGNTILSGSTLPIPQDETTPRGKVIKFLSPRTSTSWVIVAKGLRNPRRFAFDAATQQFNSALVPQSVYISDEGSDVSLTAIPRQEVNYIAGGTNSITDFDWPYREGTFERSVRPPLTPATPVATTLTPTSTGTTSITFYGHLDPKSNTGTAFYEYGLNTNTLTSNTSTVAINGTAQNVQITQTGLLPNTTYYFRLRFNYGSTSVTGSTMSITTLSTGSGSGTFTDANLLWSAADTSVHLPAPLPISTGSVLTANPSNWITVLTNAANGSTIKLAAGNYTGTFPSVAKSVTNPVTLIPDGDNALVVMDNIITMTSNVSGIRLRRLQLSPSDEYGVGFLPNAQWIEVSFCEYMGKSGGIPYRGTYMHGGTDTTYPHHCYFVNNKVHPGDDNPTRWPDGPSNFSHGVYMGRAASCVVMGNLIDPHPGWNLYGWGGFNNGFIGFNTCFAGSGRNSMTIGGNALADRGQPNNNHIRGNIFHQLFEEFQPGTGNIADYNWGSRATTATIVTWQNAIGTGAPNLAANGVPNTGSPVIAKVPNTGILWDAFGKPRPTGNCAAGALEP